ncbi:alpha-glucosidase [Loktanella sp. 3ANDIMAR09]|uniref:alpha-amylase family glycosyl hydrolase n=1 Tax=Loktanella sp. 3ANDIMAR09 TaxID=1225657 RepID=UPI0006F80673|nr:alpha-amylase family glycosyl hydrolase [Loktanella sp. 3ANDIMAR09]KQI68291.1 alpha-glucosidase [Loktanella sp. 3ANDIMAR09]
MSTREWWRDAVIYQIYPRSYQDSTGDGVGDLPGITRRLPHIASLGVDCIWLSPIFTSPMADMGYDVSNYTDIDPLFGTLDDFDEMLKTAHDLGLKVIVDQVLSHTSDQHPWFIESRKDRDNPKADWYVWADPLEDGSPPTNWHSHFGGPAWEYDATRRQYYQHNFLTSQPDLNFNNPDVQDAILDTCKFWLDRGLDGFRLDTVNYYVHDAQLRSNPPAPRPDGMIVMSSDLFGMQDNIYNKNRPENVLFIERLRALTDQYDEIMMVGEVGDHGQRSIDLMADYTKGDGRLHMAYSFAMLSDEFTPAHFRNCIESFQAGAPDGHPEWSFSNHDVVRHVSRWSKYAVSEDALARLSAAMLFSFEGTIGIYQGEELGQLETVMEYHELTDAQAIRYWPGIKGRDGCRTPMVWEADAPNAGFTDGTPWLPIKAPQAAHAVDLQEAANDSVLHFYRDIIAFRREHPCMTRGKTTFLDLPDPVLGLRRSVDGRHLTCLFNLRADAVTLQVAGAASITGPHDATLADGTLTLPGSGFVYLDHADKVTISA